MLDRKRVITMARLAMYEKGEKKDYVRINTYHKWDYVSFNIIMTMIWATIGYLVVASAWVLMNYEEILSDISIQHMVDLGTVIVAVWAVVLVVSGIVAGIFYFEKYYEAEQECREYYHRLKILNKIYAKEK